MHQHGREPERHVLGVLGQQGLFIKYAEYMQLGLTPVIVHVT